MQSVSQAPAGAKSLRRQFSWTLPANAVYGACSFMLFVVLNKFGGTAVTGDFSYALAITAPIFMFANLRFSTVLATDTRVPVRLADYFRLRAGLLLTAVAVIAISCSWNSGFGIALLVTAITLSKVIESVSELCCGVQQRIERMDRIAISLTANGVAITTSFAATYFYTRHLALSAVAMLLARLAVLMVYDLPTMRRAAHDPVFHTPFRESSGVNSDAKARARLRGLLLSAAPLGVTAALVSLTLNIPRYVITTVHSREMLGLFASVAVILQAGALIFRAVEQPAMPRLARLLDQRDEANYWRLMRRLCGLFTAIGLVSCVLSILIGPLALAFVFNADFRMLGGVLALMAIATTVSQLAGLIESSLIAARITVIQVPLHIVTVVSCAALCWLLIPRLELYGAVLAVAICRFPFMLIGVWLLRQKLAESGAESHAKDLTDDHTPDWSAAA